MIVENMMMRTIIAVAAPRSVAMSVMAAAIIIPRTIVVGRP
jgi:hypothetical protein